MTSGGSVGGHERPRLFAALPLSLASPAALAQMTLPEAGTHEFTLGGSGAADRGLDDSAGGVDSEGVEPVVENRFAAPDDGDDDDDGSAGDVDSDGVGPVVENRFVAPDDGDDDDDDSAGDVDSDGVEPVVENRLAVPDDDDDGDDVGTGVGLEGGGGGGGRFLLQCAHGSLLASEGHCKRIPRRTAAKRDGDPGNRPREGGAQGAPAATRGLVHTPRPRVATTTRPWSTSTTRSCTGTLGRPAP